LLAQVAAGDPEALTRLRTVNRVIAGSPALLAREQQAFNRTADALAALIAAETRTPAETTGTPADLRPQVAANAMLGLHRALIDYVRRRVLDEDDARGLAAEVRKLANAAFALLEHGLGDYAAKPSGPAAGPRRQPGTSAEMHSLDAGQVNVAGAVLDVAAGGLYDRPGDQVTDR
jgi:hypothetical protein